MFNLEEADYADFEMSSDLSLDDNYTIENSLAVNKALIGTIEYMLFSPRLKSINEGGFSLSWDYEGLGKFYLWLCRKYGVTPAEDAEAALGLSTITDRTNIW